MASKKVMAGIVGMVAVVLGQLAWLIHEQRNTNRKLAELIAKGFKMDPEQLQSLIEKIDAIGVVAEEIEQKAIDHDKAQQAVIENLQTRLTSALAQSGVDQATITTANVQIKVLTDAAAASKAELTNAFSALSAEATKVLTHVQSLDQPQIVTDPVQVPVDPTPVDPTPIPPEPTPPVESVPDPVIPDPAPPVEPEPDPVAPAPSPLEPDPIIAPEPAPVVADPVVSPLDPVAPDPVTPDPPVVIPDPSSSPSDSGQNSTPTE